MNMNFDTSRNLLQIACAASASIEATAEVARVGRSSLVILEVDILVNTTLIDEIVRGRHLAVEGTGVAEKGDGTEESGELHIVDCVYVDRWLGI
jgi:hypothetical protein